MKKWLACLMICALLLCAACGKTEPSAPPRQEDPAPAEPGTPQSPETPGVPETPETPETPEAPEIPETPDDPGPAAPAEPEGAVSAVQLPASVPDLEEALCLAPLEGSTAALLGRAGDKAWAVLYDYGSGRELSRLEVPFHRGEYQFTRYDAETVCYYDGQKVWKVTADGQMQLSAEEFDAAEQFRMGERVVSWQNGSILVDGKTVLQARPGKDTYLLAAVIDRNRLLYEVCNQSVGNQAAYGVYDHRTGETRLVTTLGQSVAGFWGDTLLVCRTGDNGRRYALGRMDLRDDSYAPLTIGHETADKAVDTVLCNDAGTRLMVLWDGSEGRTVQVFDVDTCGELYRWTAPAGENWSFFPVDDNRLAVWKETPGGLSLWSVEY